MEVRNRVFVVTGGGDGIGREVVLRLLGKGAMVAAVDVDPGRLAITEQQARAGDRLATFEVDVADRAAVAELPALVEGKLGPVDGVLNIAGVVHPFRRIAELSFEEIDRVFAVNLGGVLGMTKTFLPRLLQRPEGYLLNVASMGALVPVPGQGAYGASKGAVKLLTDALHAELRGTCVHVSVVVPGNIATNIVVNSGGVDPRDVVNAPVTSARDAAATIVAAIESNRYRVLVGRDAKWLDRLGRLMPTRTIDLIADRLTSKLLGPAAAEPLRSP